MCLTRCVAIARHSLRMYRQDLELVIILIAMPLGLMAFLIPAFGDALVREGYPEANGAQQAVPGMAVMFSFFTVSFIAFGFFREHGWGTWNRLRASAATPADIVIGKALASLVIAAAQLLSLFAIGGLVFSLTVRGSMGGLVVVAVPFATMMVAIGLLLAAVCHSVQQMSALSNMGAIALSGFGGAFVPLALVPGWAQAIAPATPAYWAMEGFRAVILDGAGIAEVVTPALILVAFTALFLTAAVVRFRFDESKVSY